MRRKQGIFQVVLFASNSLPRLVVAHGLCHLSGKAAPERRPERRRRRSERQTQEAPTTVRTSNARYDPTHDTTIAAHYYGIITAHELLLALPPKHAAVSKSSVLSCNFVYQRQIQCEQSAAAAKVPPINLLVSLALALTTDSLPVRDGTICIERIEEY